MRNTTIIGKKVAVLWLAVIIIHFLSLYFKAPLKDIVKPEILEKLNTNQFWYCESSFIMDFVMATIIRQYVFNEGWIYFVSIWVQDIMLFMMTVLIVSNPFQWNDSIIFNFWTCILICPILFWINEMLNKWIGKGNVKRKKL